MSDPDIVARLRVLASEFPTVNGWMDNEWKNAADEIERLHRDYSCICNEMRRTMEERDEARREILESLHPDLRKSYAAARGWDCFSTCRYCCTEDSFMTDRDRGMCGTCQRERHDDGP